MKAQYLLTIRILAGAFRRQVFRRDFLELLAAVLIVVGHNSSRMRKVRTG